MSMKKVLTLVFLRNETKVLLGMKKRGFGVDKWNGFGGKVEVGETGADKSFITCAILAVVTILLYSLFVLFVGTFSTQHTAAGQLGTKVLDPLSDSHAN